MDGGWAFPVRLARDAPHVNVAVSRSNVECGGDQSWRLTTTAGSGDALPARLSPLPHGGAAASVHAQFDVRQILLNRLFCAVAFAVKAM